MRRVDNWEEGGGRRIRTDGGTLRKVVEMKDKDFQGKVIIKV